MFTCKMNTRQSFVRCILLVLCGLWGFQQARAQVILQDSLALVALYNAQPLMGDSTTWLQGNVSTWTGVTVEGNRVTEFRAIGKSINVPIPDEICGLDTLNFLSLQRNYFTGSIPACIIDMPYLRDLLLGSNNLSGVEAGTDFSHMNSIRQIDIAYNYFTEMPDFVSIPSPDFETLHVSYNHFNFDDLLPLLDRIDTTGYYYYPQNSGYSTVLVFTENAAVDFPDAGVMAGGTGNSYRWYAKDFSNNDFPLTSPRFSNVNGPSLHIEGALPSDNAYYRCDVTNPMLPHLVWQTGFLGLQINPLLQQEISYDGNTFAFCGDPVTLSAYSWSGNPVLFESLDTDIATVNADNTLNIYKRGTLPIRCIAPQDAVFRADTLLVDIIIASRVALPEFQIASQLPSGEGEELKYTVEYFPELSYQWTLPSGEVYEGSTLTVSPLTASDLGTYELHITEGSCLHRTLSTSFNALIYGKPIIYELITPNGDGDNETFYIKNLDPSLPNEVSIFNATHQIVYHQENYRNDWDGGGLPVGTYYYTVKLGETTYKGNLYIKR